MFHEKRISDPSLDGKSLIWIMDYRLHGDRLFAKNKCLYYVIEDHEIGYNKVYRYVQDFILEDGNAINVICLVYEDSISDLIHPFQIVMRRVKVSDTKTNVHIEKMTFIAMIPTPDKLVDLLESQEYKDFLIRMKLKS